MHKTNFIAPFNDYGYQETAHLTRTNTHTIAHIYKYIYIFKATNNNGRYRYADKAVMPVFCKYTY